MGNISKRRKRLYIILSIVVIVLYIGSIAMDFILEGLVKKEILGQLNNKPGSLYTLSFDDVNIQIFRGRLKVSNLELTPSDSANQLLENGKISKLIHSRIPEFQIRNLKIIDLLFRKKIDIDAISTEGIELKYMINSTVDEPEKTNTFILHNIFSESFSEATIGEISINANSLLFFSVDANKSLFDIDSLSVNIKDIKIDQESIKLPIPIKFKDIQINTGHFSLNSLNDYRIATSGLQFDVQNASLTVNEFQLIPKHSREEFNKIKQYNDDLFSIKTTSITFNGLSVEELEFKGILSFESIEILEPMVEIYRDKRLPDAPFKYKPLLGGMVHKIPIDVNIDSLLITSARLRYLEQTEASNEPGVVFFNPLFLTATNVTNNPELIERNPSMIIDVTGDIMAESKLNARIEVDLKSDFEEFSISGTLEPTTGTIFNPMIERLLPASIKSADLRKTHFQFNANDNISNGTLNLEYENLTVEVIKAKDQSKKAGLISAVANGLIRQHNVQDKGKYIVGTVRFERRKDRAIVNFLWNSIKSGIISVVAPFADQNKKFEKQEQKESKKDQREEKKTKRKNRKKSKE